MSSQLCQVFRLQQHCGAIVTTVCYSGGLDSSILLLLVTLTRQNTTRHQVVHVRHLIYQFPRSYVSYSQSSFRRYGMAVRVAIAELSKRDVSYELGSRILRYKTLTALNGTNVIWVGHHLNDQLETFVILLNRGSGLSGLSGVPQVGLTSLSTIKLRPFLLEERFDLRCSAVLSQIPWLLDISNTDQRCLRGFLRAHPSVLRVPVHETNNFTRVIRCFQLTNMAIAQGIREILRYAIDGTTLLSEAAILGKSFSLRAFYFWLKDMMGCGVTTAKLREIARQHTLYRRDKDTAPTLHISLDKTLTEEIVAVER